MENKPTSKSNRKKIVVVIVIIVLSGIVAFTTTTILTSTTLQTEKEGPCKYNSNPEGWLDGELKPAIENCQYERECESINYPSYRTLEEAQDECYAYFARQKGNKVSCEKIQDEDVKEKCYQTFKKN